MHLIKRTSKNCYSERINLKKVGCGLGDMSKKVFDNSLLLVLRKLADIYQYLNEVIRINIGANLKHNFVGAGI